MTLPELVTMLKSTGYPVAFSHFRNDNGAVPPKPPFITYLTPSSDNFIADNQVYHKVTNVDIELYTSTKDLVAEAAIEDALDANSLPYQSVQVWIDSQQVFQKIYEVRLI